MSDNLKNAHIRVVSSLGGVIWVIGWIFTIGFAKLIWWQGIIGIVIWPYYLGTVLGGSAI